MRSSTETPEEKIKLREALEAYEKHFGNQYFFQFGIDNETTEETIAIINRCIATGKKKRKRRYKDGVLY